MIKRKPIVSSKSGFAATADAEHLAKVVHLEKNLETICR